MSGDVTRTGPDVVGEPAEQRRILWVLVAAQILSGAGLAAGITVGALLAQQMLGSTDLAGVATALFTAGSAATAAVVGRVSHRLGRRVGLTLGYAAGAVGSGGVVVAAVVDNVALLFVSMVVYGAGTATNLQARYAGADLAAPARRGRAVSIVLVATTLGGVVGPNLVSVMSGLATSWGIPPLAGPFILAGAAYAVAAAILGVALRPDPLLLAREIAAAPRAPGSVTDDVQGSRAGVGLGATVMVLTQIVMVAIMTMTPVHMAAHGHGVGAAGVVIAVHVAAMYLPSPVTGWLVDKVGRIAVAAASGVTLLASGIIAAVAPDDSVVVLTVALALLGLGWNLGLVSGTAILTDSVPLVSRAKTQGAVDVCIAISGAGAGLASGVVVAAAGFATLTVAGGVVALAVLPIIVATSGARRAAL